MPAGTRCAVPSSCGRDRALHSCMPRCGRRCLHARRREDTMIRDVHPLRTAAILLCIAVACTRSDRTETKEPEAPMTITLASPAFAANGPIPAAHTCDGRDV